MEANVFLAKLKADGSKSDLTDLDSVFKDYKDISAKLATKDRGPFSLNVLCVLCRNLEKVPSWRSAVDPKALVTLSVECARETRTLNPQEETKRLACIYHIHKHVTRQNSSVAPELILKLSSMPFEAEQLIPEYCKTYWNILADRIIFIERLKSQKRNVIMLLQKFTDDVVKVIKIYNTVQFISTIITFLFKKLHLLFTDVGAKNLNLTFGRIFEELQSKPDIKYFKKLPSRELFDVYMILNDCLYVVAENNSKSNFDDNVLTTVVQTCISLVGHQQDLLHCLQTVYLNGFCSVFYENCNLTYVETILTNFVTSCETTEKLGYTKAINATYPYISQCLRLYLEVNLKKTSSELIQTACLKLMEFLMKKLNNCDQILKCENCSVKTGLHDALRLGFLSKNFITIPLQGNMSVTKILPLYWSVILRQYEILDDLCKQGCGNYDKCYKKLQSDIHNTAISLNKSQNFEYSIKLFELYLKNEIVHFKDEGDLKNISRALYNKSICELDCKQYDSALLDAYLSLVFAYPDGLQTQKHMSLVMDIKAKVLKSKDDESQQDSDMEGTQMMTVVDACADAVEKKTYGNLKPFFCNLKFSALLNHEFQMYAKLWPAVLPIAGVWKTLHDLTEHDIPWLVVTDEATQRTLHDVILATPSVVRSIHNEHLTDIVTQLLQTYEETPPNTAEGKVFHATLLFMKAEFDLTKAAMDFGWKPTEPSMDPDQFVARRTLSQEHEAAKCAITAVEVWTDLLQDIHTVPATCLQMALQTAQVFVTQLLHLYRISPALQLAHICCHIAEQIQDKTSYITNAGVIIHYANKNSDKITEIITQGTKNCAELLKCDETVEAALVFLGECAIYYTKSNSLGTAAKLTQAIQAKILSHHNNKPELNLDLAVGKLLEAQVAVCKDSSCPSGLSSVIGAHRHYLAVGNTATKWCLRRRRALHLKLHIARTGVVAATAARNLHIWRRAKSCAGATLTAATSVAQAMLVVTITDPAHTQNASVQIDNHLKYVLGIELTTSQPIVPTPEAKAHQLFTPKQELETMLENMTFKKSQVNLGQTSPTLDVPGFKCPVFLKHGYDCTCYACENPYSFILAAKSAALEASMYFRAKEFDIAKNYFDGTLKCLQLVQGKLKKVEKCENYLQEIVKKIYNDEFVEVQIRTLIESAFFELSQGNYKIADERIVSIHEILQDNENINPYLRNEILNLMTSSAHIQKQTNPQISEINLEADFENLKLSPTKTIELIKTPEDKAKNPPKLPILKVPNEELPNTKRRVIKLNFDESSSDEFETTKKRTSKRTEFKIPVPVTAKPVLETMTPTPASRSRKKPDILVTQPSKDESTSVFEFATPKPKDANKSEFFTPVDTPGDQFFTPMSTLKTYSKKSLRHGIVKNLECEFATPKAEAKNADKKDKTLDKDVKTLDKDVKNIDNEVKTIDKEVKTIDKTQKATDKENLKSNTCIPKKKVETGSLKSLKDKRSLKRATSPGKLVEDEKKPTRSSRLRKPVKLSLDDSDK
ncbi:hypothetical protein NE865_12640 [Phthorimaea operculella]|nr:hypothetical protein NE865_12640 [Phthorimaea operculella]